MWKVYSRSYLKNNRGAGRPIMAAAFVASMFLSLLCAEAYNLWVYEGEKIALKEGEWQSSPAYDLQGGRMPMLLTVYLAILLLVVLSLILIIRNSFEVSMNARIHQFGILSSIGATPRQIRICLLQEAAVLSLLPMLFGALAGIMISYGLIGAVNIFASGAADRHKAVFCYRPFLLVATLLISAFTVLASAWAPARKLSRMTPLEAVRDAGGFQMNKRKHSRILARLFGVEGELAGNALKAQRKALRISTLSLLLSFLGFSLMLVFTTLAAISTRYTYFERYQDAWDVMVTLKDTEIADFHLTKELREIAGAADVAVYQKAEAKTYLTEELQSGELAALGGFGAVSGRQEREGQFSVDAPIVILDDAAFLTFCSRIGVTPSLDGAVVLNRIWDSINSNFRYPAYVPFVKEDKRVTVLSNSGGNGESVEIPVLSYTQTVPVLREEYQEYALVHFMPLALWEEKAGQIGGAKPDSYIRVLAKERTALADLNGLEKEIDKIVSTEYEAVSENRIQERMANDRMILGMQVILGAFCVLLAMIGIANVFSNTLGFLRQRKREFARYMSIGLTPREMRKLFCIEACVIAGRPFLITLPLAALFAQFCVRASYLDPAAFWREAPIFPILLFAAAIAGFVALAYYIGGKRLLQCDLNEILRNDTLV